MRISNQNFLAPNSFSFTIERLPLLSFFVKSVSMPGVNLQQLEQPTPLSIMNIPSDKLDFQQLQVQFMVDEAANNWHELFKWMEGLGFPYEHEQYTRVNDAAGLPGQSELMRNYSDAELSILGSNNLPVKRIKFINCYPVDLGGFELSSQNTTVTYVIASATFVYNRFEVT